jgi:hypothetical protein
MDPNATPRARQETPVHTLQDLRSHEIADQIDRLLREYFAAEGLFLVPFWGKA